MGKRALVIGGTRGIGKATAKKLLEKGYDVCISARNVTEIEKNIAEYQTEDLKCLGDVVDISEEPSIEKLKNNISKNWPGIDVLVLNVSALSANWEEAVKIDLMGTVNCVKHFLPLMKENSTIIYIGSKASSMPTPGFEAYGAMKACLAHYMKSLSVTLAEQKIRVNVVSPGDTFEENGFWDKIKSTNAELYEKVKNLRGYHRFCTPQEVANTVLFLASEESSFINGANIYVDGGSQDIVRF